MILRRVIDHFRKQEWAAIAIDFVIVVLGVFVGLQVSNWNGARADHDRAKTYLTRIAGDMAADIDDYEDRLEFWGAVSTFGATGLSYAERGETGGRSYWDIVLAYFQASQVAEFFTTSATWDEMRGGGELRLIENVDLRTLLSRFYTYAGNPALSERPAYREHARERIPLAVQSYIWANCYGSDTSGRQRFIDCAPPVDEPAAKAVADALAADEPLMRELRYWMSTMEIAARIGRDRMAAAREAKAAVEAEIAGMK